MTGILIEYMLSYILSKVNLYITAIRSSPPIQTVLIQSKDTIKGYNQGIQERADSVTLDLRASMALPHTIAQNHSLMIAAARSVHHSRQSARIEALVR